MELEVLEAYADLKISNVDLGKALEDSYVRAAELEAKMKTMFTVEDIKPMFDIYGDSVFINDKYKPLMNKWLINNGDFPVLEEDNEI